MDKKYIIAGALLVITVILGIVLVYPKYQEFSASAQALSDKQAELDKENQTVAAITKVFDSYKKASQNISRVNSLLPPMDAQTIPKLFMEMEGLTSQSGLLLKSISFSGGSISSSPGLAAPTDAAKQKGYKTISVKLSAEGSYASLKQFGDAVQSNEHLMDVISFSISGGSAAQSLDKKTDSANAAPAQDVKKAAEDNFNSDMTINTYYQ